MGGPVGSGKTTLVEKLCKAMRSSRSLAVITNDIYTREDALILARLQALPEDRIVGVETGGFPHTALREAASINLAALRALPARKGGPAISRSDLLVINKSDLAPHVGADLGVMAGDAQRQRGERPVVFTDLTRGVGVDAVVDFITERGGV